MLSITAVETADRNSGTLFRDIKPGIFFWGGKCLTLFLQDATVIVSYYFYSVYRTLA
ncbi:hypothetical protein TREPR_3077 [Treponema primitia ZAS-2]|uniref:Uncharacterized protein n=1 Tax=Treponema primitia (strain ATCC BAA-887 / DSM 12427 / ZAS-2) TaxID=545694 RepID=F5YMN0_TREPZ|nr:hypothetical protein TREPR_3077 [Treponema primitia ZAS-2]